MTAVETRSKSDTGPDTRPVHIGLPLTWLTVSALVLITAVVRAEAELALPPRTVADDNSQVVEPVPMPAKSRKSRTIFACRTGALVEFADRPCDIAATSRSLEFTTGTGPGSTPSTRPRESLASTRPKVAATPADAVSADAVADARDDEAQRKKCTTLQGQLDAVDSRMREGYGARDAARLWNRWRELKEEIRTSAC
jgi:hypothetical protein